MRDKGAKSKMVEVPVDTLRCDGAYCAPRNEVDMEPTDHRVPAGWSQLISHEPDGSVTCRFICGICTNTAVRK